MTKEISCKEAWDEICNATVKERELRETGIYVNYESLQIMTTVVIMQVKHMSCQKKSGVKVVMKHLKTPGISL